MNILILLTVAVPSMAQNDSDEALFLTVDDKALRLQSKMSDCSMSFNAVIELPEEKFNLRNYYRQLTSDSVCKRTEIQIKLRTEKFRFFMFFNKTEKVVGRMDHVFWQFVEIGLLYGDSKYAQGRTNSSTLEVWDFPPKYNLMCMSSTNLTIHLVGKSFNLLWIFLAQMS